MTARTHTVSLILALASVLAFAVPDLAEARRGGSFGSRGMRTYSPPPATRTAPRQTAPVERSMAPKPAAGQPSAARPQAAGAAVARRPGLLGNPLVRGLLLGGLIGALLGYGFGGAAGALGAILQIALFAGLALLAMNLFAAWRARRSGPATATAAGGDGRPSFASQFQFEQPAVPAGSGAYLTGQAVAEPSDEIGIEQADLDAFEQLLKEVQGAFGAEDYAAIRDRSTPEVMSYLAEELGRNATNGLRNEVRDITLVQADLSEAWREDDVDYATAALAYDSIDVMRDRTTGAVREGDPERPTRATELWTFSRRPGEPWKLSAIQEA